MTPVDLLLFVEGWNHSKFENGYALTDSLVIWTERYVKPDVTQVVDVGTHFGKMYYAIRHVLDKDENLSKSEWKRMTE